MKTMAKHLHKGGSVMTLLCLATCVFALGIIEHEQYKDLRDRNKR